MLLLNLNMKDKMGDAFSSFLESLGHKVVDVTPNTFISHGVKTHLVGVPCKVCAKMEKQFMDDVKSGKLEETLRVANSGRKLYQLGVKDERQRIKDNIRFLRQWLNEKPPDLLVTNEAIETWLGLTIS